MALLGVLSILQIVFLPGYLLVRVLRLRGGVLATLVLAFALSLIANHALVVGSSCWVLSAGHRVCGFCRGNSHLSCGLERRSLADRCISTLAGFASATSSANSRSSPLRQNPVGRRDGRHRGIRTGEHGPVRPDLPAMGRRRLLEPLGDRLGRKPLAHASRAFIRNSCPRACRSPMSSSRPATFWIFAKAFQFLFCLMLLLAMVDAARATGDFGFVPGALITYWLLVAVLRFRMIGSGYADVPLAFFAFASVYALLLARHAEASEVRRYVMVGAVLAGGAALAKQTGLYVALVYPLLAWLLVFRSGHAGDRRRHAGTLLRAALLAGALAAPWYLYKFAEFHAARDADNTALLVHDFHEGRNLPQRLLHAASTVAEATTPAGAVLLLLAIALALRDPLQRWLVGLVIVPLGLVWAAGFSYDLRNLALVLPFAGAAAGTVALHVVERLGRGVGQARPRRCRPATS